MTSAANPAQPHEDGWRAGTQMLDPRTCPYRPVTHEALAWKQSHRLGVALVQILKQVNGD